MLPLVHWPAAARTLVRTFGVRGAALRAAHEARRKAGRFRAAPLHADTDPDRGTSTPDHHLFHVGRSRLAAHVDRAAALDRAERVVAGSHQAYRWSWQRLPQDTDGWVTHPGSGMRYPGGESPWWHVPHLHPSAGDIKDLWEPARFGWAYDLVRAHLLTDDPRYARAFAQRFAEWSRSSPPFAGPHWSCGQEAAIRAIALLYVEANLPPVAGLARVLAASGERIADAIGYATSQRNNHAISEAAALVALGVRFHDRHPEAAQWLATGRALLPRLIAEQFAEDGWYIQHSFTYLRLALDQCVVAERALRAADDTLPGPAVLRLRKATELLLAVMDPGTGDVPNHGANDGAFVHPVTLAGFRDFRPAVTAACATWGFALPTNVKADAETLAWLGLATPAPAPPLGDGLHTGASGWAAVRSGRVHVFLRAGRYASRPSHLDPLQLDVRIDGNPIVVDPGTYAYNGPAPWRNGLVTARVHNGPMLDDQEPGVRGPRFLWYLWPEAALLRADRDADGDVMLVAETPAGVRRTVRVTRDWVEVEDVLPPSIADEVVVRWLLHPDAPADVLDVDGPSETVAATEGSPIGWYSPGYGARLPSRAVTVRRPARDGATIVTTIDPRPTA